MKKILFSFISIISFNIALAQNVGIGTTEPLNRLHINGNLLVNTPTIAPSTTPTVAQTKTMVNASTVSFASADSTGRIYDPGGPAGNYNGNLLANAFIDYNFTGCIGIEITVETMQLGIGDSLFVSEASGFVTLLAVGNGYTTTGKWVFNSPLGSLYLVFKSNADASVGTGFSLLFRRLYDNSQLLPDVTGYAGKAVFFDTKSGAFRTGTISNQAKGFYSNAMGDFTTASGYASTALGSFTTASGDYSTASGLSANATGDRSAAIGNGTNASGYSSTAIGNNTQAQGDYSTAFGYKSKAVGIKSTAFGDSTKASGDYSTSLGYHTWASGDYSTAMGYNSFTSGDYSTAMGVNTIASGLRSTAMGYNASTNGQANSFAIGGTGAATNCTSPNQFMTRFDNYTFWISASNYAYLLPASNGWAYTSDKNKKERFEELNGETVLNKISKIPFTSWNFKAADTKQYRHYGIMAQDFYNAFGEDSYGKIGNDTTVSPLDLLGVAYSAIKALEKRTANLLQDNKQLKEENALLQKSIDEIKQGYALANAALNKKLTLLETKLNELAAINEKETTTTNKFAKHK